MERGGRGGVGGGGAEVCLQNIQEVDDDTLVGVIDRYVVQN